LQEKLSSINWKVKEIVVLPEMFNTGFSMSPSALIRRDGWNYSSMDEGDVASKHKVILTGSVMIRESEAYYNRLIWMQPNGEFGTYDKRHLFSVMG
jgi:omega-amidase